MSLLTRTYPFQKSEHWLRDCLAYGVAIWAILYMLQPFGFSGYQGNKFLVAALFGIITTCCCAIYEWLVFQHLFQHIKPWCIWHQGLAILGLLLFIAISNCVLFSFIFGYPITLGIFISFLYWTLAIGVFISAATVGINYNRFLRRKMEALLSNTSEEQKDILVTIHDTNVRGNDLCIPINNLLYVEARKNNVCVCHLKDGKPVKEEIHTTLTAVMEDLKDYENIFRCHRSFVVNVNNITSAQGNSNGYQLTLGACHDSIPVSRSYVPQLKAFIA
jgi:hypothetical protein